MTSIPTRRAKRPGRTVEIATIEDLDALLQQRTEAARTQVALRVAGLNPIRCAVLQEALNARLNECGCATGAAFVLASVAVSLALQLIPSTQAALPLLGVRTVLSGLLGGALGKWIGLRFARNDVRSIAARIREEML